MQLQMMLCKQFKKLNLLESNNEGYLEQLAVDLVKKELSFLTTHFNMMLSYINAGQIDTSKMISEPEELDDEEVSATVRC